jgi:response regulator of citrate/malate metabolism
MNINRSADRKMQRDIQQLQHDLLLLDITKREAELELIKEQIRTTRTSRRIMRVTATVTGLTLVATVLNYIGLFTDN